MGYKPALHKEIKNEIGKEIAKFRKLDGEKKRAAEKKELWINCTRYAYKVYKRFFDNYPREAFVLDWIPIDPGLLWIYLHALYVLAKWGWLEEVRQVRR